MLRNVLRRPWATIRPKSSLSFVPQESESPQQTSPLVDLFGRNHTYLRISLTERCNLRCRYCMPAEGVQLSEKDKLLTSEEVIHLAGLFARAGVNKIRLTGGEPTIRKDLSSIIKSLKDIPGIDSVAMTTNGLVLTRKLVDLQRAGLDVLNISLDTMNTERYEQITRRNGWKKVVMGIDLALQLGYNPVKINCVVMKGVNDDEIVDFVKFTKDRNVDVRFIEYMPFTGNKWNLDKMIPYKDMVQQITEHFPDFHPLENGPNDTSKAWKVPGHAGQVGFITSMSEHFCGSCNRLRITADGNLKVCLFGNAEVSLRDALRSGCSQDDLLAVIDSAVKRKKKQHAAHTSSITAKRTRPLLPLVPFDSTIPSHVIFRAAAALANTSPQFFHNARNYSTDKSPKKASEGSDKAQRHLTHVDETGRALMIDVSHKPVSDRQAVAQGIVQINYKLADLIKENTMKKGDVLRVAQLAGISAAKKTSELIPLCHNIAINDVKVDVELDYKRKLVVIIAKVKTTGKTGVEMEALTAVSVAALTVYDMCKAVAHDTVIHTICLLDKTGGEREYHRPTYEVNSIVDSVNKKHQKGDGHSPNIGTI